jgi:hypothetical protein
MLSPTLRYIHPLLQIPTEAKEEAFPDVSLSVLDFLQFPLPSVVPARLGLKAPALAWLWPEHGLGQKKLNI